jgi:CMP-2-keto-3-deoxyoctulosonic acid synthetase
VAIHVENAVEKVPAGIDTEKDLASISVLFE